MIPCSYVSLLWMLQEATLAGLYFRDDKVLEFIRDCVLLTGQFMTCGVAWSLIIDTNPETSMRPLNLEIHQHVICKILSEKGGDY